MKSAKDVTHTAVKKVWTFLMSAVNMVNLTTGDLTALDPSDRTDVAVIRSFVTADTSFKMLARGKAVAVGSVPRNVSGAEDLTMLGWASVGDDDEDSGMFAFVPVGTWYENPDLARAALRARNA